MRNIVGKELVVDDIRPRTEVPVGTIFYKKTWFTDKQKKKHVAIVKMLSLDLGLVPDYPYVSPLNYHGGGADLIKFRVPRVKVLEVTKIDISTGTKTIVTQARSNQDETVYRVGRIVEADGFTSDAQNDCGHGIHGVATFDNAVNFPL